MTNGWKRIGVCLTKLQDESCGQIVQALARQARAHQANLLVFNSFLDFFFGNEFEVGAASVYQLIDYQMLDALIVLDQCFYNKSLVRGICAQARHHGVPTVVLYGEYEGCFSIQSEYSDAFSQLVSHVLDHHRPGNLKYIAGIKGKPHTDKRLAIFRRTMLEHGFEVPPEMVTYCDDWRDPVLQAVNAWIQAGDIPDALICASDTMAAAACDQLAVHGFRVPQDVVVTGFDDLPSLRLHTPQLTTCGPDLDDTAAQVFRMLSDAFDRQAAPCTGLEHYRFHVSESCGCSGIPDTDFRAEAERCSRLLDTAFQNEHYLYTWSDRLLVEEEQGLNRSILQRIIPADSALLLNHDPANQLGPMSNSSAEPFSERLTAVAPADPQGKPAEATVTLHDALPWLTRDLAEDEIVVLQSIYVGSNTCGCYAVRLHDVQEAAHGIYRLCRILNLAFTVIDSRKRHARAMNQLMQAQSTDSLTGLMNLHGLSDYVNIHYPEISRKSMSVSVYVIYRYQKLLEDHGLPCVEQMVTDVAEMLRDANPPQTLVARVSESDFVVVNLADTSDQISGVIDDTVNRFFTHVEDHNNARGDRPVLEVHCGCVVSRPDWENNLMSFIKAANGEMYLNQMKSRMALVRKQDEPLTDAARMLEVLLEQNLFHYHFQPIVDAHTGEIYAYEALMRTLAPIDMKPAQVLDVAGRERRLYDIERATLFNVMEYVDAHISQFENKRVFINTIPGYFLNEADRQELTGRYSHLFSSCTIEITEMDDTDDAELMQLRRLESESGFCQLAIDDYGTGFSNIVNLLRYQPQVIKIDRYLISNIHRDNNKQLFIRSTIEFARMNGILVLAEGVETREELSKVIELGVDLVQGYYLAHPSSEVIASIPEKVQHFIIEETLRFSHFNSVRKVYHAHDGERLDLLRLAVDKYTSIQVDEGQFTLVGKRGHAIDMPINVSTGSSSRLILEDVCINAPAPAISLGDSSNVVLEIRGEERFEQEGIRVPQGASLRIVGDGSLDISSLQKKGTVLGGAPDESFGRIVIDMTGKLRVQAESETSICIGGGYKDYDEPIELLGGAMTFEARGIHTVAVGCLEGVASVYVGPNASLKMKVVGNEAVGLGTLSGTVRIESHGVLDMTVDGERITGIGTLNSGAGQVRLAGPDARFVMHGANSVCVGSIGGAVEVVCGADRLDLYMEGARTCGLGNRTGDGSVLLCGGTFASRLLSSSPLHMMPGSVITGGNILITGDESSVYAVSPWGDILMPLTIPDQDRFEESIACPGGDYVYRAERRTEKQLCVFVPASFVRSYLLR